MGNKDYLSGGCDMGWCADLPGKLCYEKLDKKSENDYMIMPENLNTNLEFGANEVALNPPSPQHTQKNQIWILCQNSLTRELKIRVVVFVLKKLYFKMLIVPHAL